MPLTWSGGYGQNLMLLRLRGNWECPGSSERFSSCICLADPVWKVLQGIHTLVLRLSWFPGAPDRYLTTLISRFPVTILQIRTGSWRRYLRMSYAIRSSAIGLQRFTHGTDLIATLSMPSCRACDVTSALTRGSSRENLREPACGPNLGMGDCYGDQPIPYGGNLTELTEPCGAIPREYLFIWDQPT
jgi:hypothetical protein